MLELTVMTKHKDYHNLNRSNARHMVTVWGFLILAVISGIITLNAYIGNSREAKRRYDILIATDAAGGDVEGALRSLRTYIYAHMNTTIGSPTGVRPPIQLKGTYDRLTAAERARAAAAKEANAGLYTKAQAECERLIPDGLSGRGRVPCITEYVTKNSQSETEQTIPDGLYKYDFVSPIWSADTAGIGMIVTAILGLVFVYRIVTYKRVKRHLHLSS